jgi:hypothetical protein
MTKEQLIKMGLTEEQATAVMKELDGNFVTKTRFDEINQRMQTAEKTVKERDKQIEMLKKSTGDVEALKTQITELQTANTKQAETHAAEIKTLKLNTALSAALTAAKAKNTKAVEPFLSDFLAKAEVDDKGVIKGLDAEIKKLTDSDDTKFLFDTVKQQQQKPNFKGLTPQESNTDDVKPATLGEAIKAGLEAQIKN